MCGVLWCVVCGVVCVACGLPPAEWCSLVLRFTDTPLLCVIVRARSPPQHTARTHARSFLKRVFHRLGALASLCMAVGSVDMHGFHGWYDPWFRELLSTTATNCLFAAGCMSVTGTLKSLESTLVALRTR